MRPEIVDELIRLFSDVGIASAHEPSHREQALAASRPTRAICALIPERYAGFDAEMIDDGSEYAELLTDLAAATVGEFSPRDGRNPAGRIRRGCPGPTWIDRVIA